jgi:cellulose synthase (UDP-forming)
MSLLGSRKFWAARMRFRTRCCYFSGFCYYLHTAVFTFAAPAIPLVMLIVLPENVRLANYVFIAPSMIYNLVVFPAWHRCRFGPTALMAKLLYGWAHVIAIFDILRRKRMGWQTTGEGKRKVGIRRVWVGISIWNGGTGLAWVSLAVWRMTHYGVVFIPLLATGLLVCTITAMALGSRRNNDLITQGAAR